MLFYGCDGGHDPVAWWWTDGYHCWVCDKSCQEHANVVWRRHGCTFMWMIPNG